jgi:predicted ATP-dependent endonuclease of OLD family
MELTKIQIENFRSIKSETIVLDYNCLILLGKNEAGKSNVLKAIAAVLGEYTVLNKDKRKRIDNEEIKDYYIRAIIKLNESDFVEVQKRLEIEYTGLENITFKNKKTLLDYIKTFFNEIIIQINIKDNEETDFRYWKYSKKDFVFENKIHLNKKALNNEGVGIEFNLDATLFAIINTIYSENPYRCLYWNYDNDYLLPSSIAISDFIARPSKYKSLENLFILCKRGNIKEEFEAAINQDGDYENLLEQISKTVTSTFRNIWTDFKDTSIQLRPNGTEISIKVANKAKYTFEDRSDGFKKFISILLMVSTQARSNKIGEKDIILIDEPDQSLYPTSARLLRDELLKISEKSKVIYSTHSQYMIDSNCIDRHLIVEKKDDITSAKKEDKNAPFSNDELLRQAIGSSIFECLNEKNIIFEGWLDKELFNKYCKFHKKTNDYKNIGIVYLGGISGVESLVQLLTLANKKFVIVADSDEASKNKKIEFDKNYKEYSNSWLSYSDIHKDISTMEDFITSEHISNNIKTFSPEFIFNDSKNAIQNIEFAVSKDKVKKQEIKNKLIDNIEKKHIKENYGEYIIMLKKSIDNL